jgi:type I restriction enzyme S subunit
MAAKDSIKLKTVCLKIGSGATPRGGKEAYKGGATALIRSQNIYNDGFRKDGIVYIDDTQASELKNVEVFNGDVLLNITGDSVARCCQVSADILPARVNQHVAIIRPDPKTLDARYLHYILVSNKYQEQLLSLASAGATRPALTKLMIENLEVHLPHLAEQTRIAGILGALDDKIEHNRKMNETLEQMAKALFKSWFVDFNPVNAKAECRETVGMDKAKPDPFPDCFVDSELGKIPKGWEIQRIGDVAECVGGATPRTNNPTYWDGGTHSWATPKDLASLKSPFLLDTDRKITNAGVEQISSGILQAGTLLLSSRAPVGYLAIATTPVAINQGFIAIKPNERISTYFLLNWCQSNMPQIETRATGTTFPEISKKNFRSIPIVLPPEKVVRLFTERAESFYGKIAANLIESRTLIEMRGALLPKLLSENSRDIGKI